MARLGHGIRFRLDHRWAPGHMSDYLDHDLDRRARARLERHTSVCSKCRAVLEALRRLTAALGRLPAPEGAGRGPALAIAVRGRLNEPEPGRPI